MKIISHSRIENHVSYSLVYDYTNSPGTGFAFDCDENGRVDVEKMHPAGRANYDACLAGTYNTVRVGVQKWEHSYRVPTIGECTCGAEVELAHFTNTCHECGRDYNGSGQELAPREQWGEETGEHWSDCY